VVIAQAERLVVAAGADDRQHRTEDLFRVDAHVLGHLIEQAAADVETVLVALHREATAVDQQLGAFLHPRSM